MNMRLNKKLNLNPVNPIINWKIGLVLKFNGVLCMCVRRFDDCFVDYILEHGSPQAYLRTATLFIFV